MTVLVLNAGSSSLKVRLYAGGSARSLARAVFERIGGAATATLAVEDRPSQRRTADVTDHAAATRNALEWLRSLDVPTVDAVGHRVVHGGARFTAPVRIDDEVVRAIEALEGLAPLHNRPAL
jgi:acetate kinase